MLPDRLIDLNLAEDATRVPSWLTSRDEVWLRSLCDEIEACAGRTVAGTEVRVKELADLLARQHGVAARRVEGVWLVERRRWKKQIDAPIAPERIRSVVFDFAARHDRGEALARAAHVLAVDSRAIERFLFADRDGERIVVPPDAAPSPASLVDAYNLALAQSLLARSLRITARVRSDASHVVSYAKLLGLMIELAPRDDSIEMELSGPLALFHETTKYGRAVARFLPALVSTVGWAAVAEVRLRGEVHVVRLTSSDPLPRTHGLPRSTDSDIEKRLALAIRRLGPERGWRLERESAIVSTGIDGQLFCPDFTLVSETGARVLVEVVGFWTPDYLAKKQRAISAVHAPIVVCVNERHAGELGVVTTGSSVVITYRDRIDAAELLDAAERALAGATI